MNQTISDYAKDKQIETILVNELIDKLTYLVSIKNSIYENLLEINSMISEMEMEINSILLENKL